MGRWNKAVHHQPIDYFIVSPTGKPNRPEEFRLHWNRWLRTQEGKELVKRWTKYVQKRRQLFGYDVDPEELAKPTPHGLRSTAVANDGWQDINPSRSRTTSA
jgi:hypothetical protein